MPLRARLLAIDTCYTRAHKYGLRVTTAQPAHGGRRESRATRPTVTSEKALPVSEDKGSPFLNRALAILEIFLDIPR